MVWIAFRIRDSRRQTFFARSTFRPPILRQHDLDLLRLPPANEIDRRLQLRACQQTRNRTSSYRCFSVSPRDETSPLIYLHLSLISHFTSSLYPAHRPATPLPCQYGYICPAHFSPYCCELLVALAVNTDCSSRQP